VHVAATIDPPAILEPILKKPSRQMLIGGEWTDGGSGKTFDVLDPSTGRVIANVPRCRSSAPR
jgi:hypothetical protein